jgi:hypothetical protein
MIGTFFLALGITNAKLRLKVGIHVQTLASAKKEKPFLADQVVEDIIPTISMKNFVDS